MQSAVHFEALGKVLPEQKLIMDGKGGRRLQAQGSHAEAPRSKEAMVEDMMEVVDPEVVMMELDVRLRKIIMLGRLGTKREEMGCL